MRSAKEEILRAPGILGIAGKNKFGFRHSRRNFVRQNRVFCQKSKDMS
jgi:hypothetical protein